MGGPSPALLMDAPPAAETASCPPGASPDERRALGYNAEARLAGSSLSAFLSVAEVLRDMGVRAPRVFAADPERGLAIIGDALLVREAADPAAEVAHYARAGAVLARVRAAGASAGPFADGLWTLQTYDDTALMAEVRLLTEWYVPHVTGAPASEGAAAAFEAAWREALSALGPRETLVLRDYHAENLIVLDREGADGIGVIDFQDALVGSSAYDLASLIEDARRDVSPAAVKAAWAAGTEGVEDVERFEADYAILAAQRNTKILGIFARLNDRDAKAKYPTFFPRIKRHLARDLAHPGLAAVRAWTEEHLPEVMRG